MDKEMKEIREKLGVLVEEFLDSDSSSNEERRSIQISSSSSSESEEEKVEPKLTKSQEIMLKKRFMKLGMGMNGIADCTKKE